MRKWLIASFIASALVFTPAALAHADLFFSEDDPGAGHITANNHGNVVILPGNAGVKAR